MGRERLGVRQDADGSVSITLGRQQAARGPVELRSSRRRDVISRGGVRFHKRLVDRECQCTSVQREECRRIGVALSWRSRGWTLVLAENSIVIYAWDKMALKSALACTRGGPHLRVADAESRFRAYISLFRLLT